MPLKKYLLVISFFAIGIIALLYGVSPKWFYQSFLLDSSSPTVDQSHILRAVMMLYITLGCFWLFCAFNDKYRDSGILVLGLFCGGLVSGRFLSLSLDGMPSPLLIVYILLELAMVPICIWLLVRPDQG